MAYPGFLWISSAPELHLSVEKNKTPVRPPQTAPMCHPGGPAWVCVCDKYDSLRRLALTGESFQGSQDAGLHKHDGWVSDSRDLLAKDFPHIPEFHVG